MHVAKCEDIHKTLRAAFGHTLERRMSISIAASGERPRASLTCCLCSNYSPEGRVVRSLGPARDRLVRCRPQGFFSSERGIAMNTARAAVVWLDRLYRQRCQHHGVLRRSARSQPSFTHSAREARTGFRRHQHVAIIDFHFKSVGRQCRELDQSAADDVVTPTAFAAADMSASDHAQCKRRSAANAKVTKRVDSTIKIEQRDLNSVDIDYRRLSMVRSTLRPDLDEIGLGHKRQHVAISLFNCSES